MTVDLSSKRSRGRPRSENARSAVLKAAYEILVDSGFGSFSIDAVSVRSGVARSTIHRWWASKGMLAIESCLEHVLASISFRITTSSSRDVMRILENTAAKLAGPEGKVVASIIAEGQRDPDALELFSRVYFHPLRAEAIKVVQAGIDRGEFRPNLDAGVFLDSGIGAMYAKVLLQQPITKEWVKTLTEQLLNAARAMPSSEKAGTRRRCPGVTRSAD
ncbi:MAG TPA: TetR/AcrR family transcriptional regulator C-terminal ligand-binding domain-containing protein [Rhizorhapis sp.]|nr:TetR/AcrR family transcriptional regulator C-terminal ligand-binding domain-containing protein [Rhizorhapis sp.]